MHRFHINQLPDKFNNDREILNEISKIDGYKTLLFASDELGNDKDFVRMAVQQNFAAFELASSELKRDRDFVEEMVKNHGECLIFSAEEHHDDEEIVELALKSSPDAIHCISD